MEYTISNGAINLMVVGATYSLVLPLLLCVIFKKRFKAHLKPFFLGMLTYLAFSFFLANILNGLILQFIDADSLSTPLLFILLLFSQAIVAVIAQVGKYYSIHILKNDPKPDKYAHRGDALEFGTGFAGLEAVMTIGVTMTSYIMYASIILGGNVQSMLDSYTGADAAQIQGIFETLSTTPVSNYVAVILQGVAMILFQLASTLLVYRAVYGENDKAYFRLAIVFHIIMVVPGCIINAGLIKSIWFETILTLVFGIASLVYAYDKIKEYEKKYVKDMLGTKKGKKIIHLK